MHHCSTTPTHSQTRKRTQSHANAHEHINTHKHTHAAHKTTLFVSDLLFHSRAGGEKHCGQEATCLPRVSSSLPAGVQGGVLETRPPSPRHESGAPRTSKSKATNEAPGEPIQASTSS